MCSAGVAQLVRARVSYARGRRFESVLRHQPSLTPGQPKRELRLASHAKAVHRSAKREAWTVLSMDLLAQVRRTIRDHRLAQPDTRVVVALSGGADSVALAHLVR